MGGLWHYIYELLMNILCVWGVIAFEFFSRCIVSVSDVDIPCVVSIAEDLTKFYWGGGRGGGAIHLTCSIVFDLTDSHDSILVIVHFDHENSFLWWDFFVRYFSRCTVDTFQRAVVCLFVGFLVGGHPLLIFLPGLVVETCAGEDRRRTGRRQRRGRMSGGMH
jgi:hypothetical protein